MLISESFCVRFSATHWQSLVMVLMITLQLFINVVDINFAHQPEGLT